MSYACFNTIYGIPLNRADLRGATIVRPEILDDLLESEAEGFVRYYSGSGNPEAFGIDYEKGFNECAHHLEMSEVDFTVPQETIEEFNKLYAALDDDVREALKIYGEPRAFVLVSSS